MAETSDPANYIPIGWIRPLRYLLERGKKKVSGTVFEFAVPRHLLEGLVGRVSIWRVGQPRPVTVEGRGKFW